MKIYFITGTISGSALLENYLFQMTSKFPENDASHFPIPAQKQIKIIEDLVTYALKNDGEYYILSYSDIIFNSLRLMILQEKISPDQVVVYFHTENEKQILTFNDYAVLSEYPNGFFDVSIKLSETILSLALKKARSRSK